MADTVVNQNDAAAAGSVAKHPRGPYRADVVIPCYQEEEALPHTVPVLLDFFSRLVADPSNRLAGFRVILVNDGSSDRTWQIIAEMSERHPQIEGIKLSRNFGHQSAMLAGLMLADADVVITMDADLQDDIAAVADMIAAYEGGSHLALGVRNDRSSDSAKKESSAVAYYRLMRFMGADIVENHADFRLMSRTALDALKQYREVNVFLRGIIPTLGFPVTLVYFKRNARVAGEVKYTFRKLLRLALDGITSFSVMPLRMIAFLGAAIFAGTMIVSLIFLYLYFAERGEVVPGWASTVLPMLFLGGVQLLSIGILGEYVGMIYLETKRRPRFIVEETTSSTLSANAASEVRRNMLH